MATVPSDPRPILGRVDRDGRLIAADPELERLQADAGSRLGAPLALPQLAAIARTARRLQIPVSRRAIAASSDQDIDMWVRAEPDGDEVALSIEQWRPRPGAAPRLSSRSSAESLLPHETPRWEVDEQLRVIAVSATLAEALGVAPSEAAGEALTKLVRLEESDDGSMPLLAALSSRAAFSGQRAQSRATDSTLFLSGEPVFRADGEFGGFQGSADVPETAMKPARQSSDQLDQLLQAPLDRIIDFAGRIADRADGPLRHEYAVYAEDISTAAQHLLSVVRSMGQEPASGSSRLDLAELAKEAVALIESAAVERGIGIALQPAEPCFAVGDPRGVIQILVNLIGNAVRHSSDGASVTISIERVNGTALVHVQDNGPGIADADQERIFERFETGGGGQGSGLGLAIARRLARGMDGDVKLESRPGEGATFTLVLPAV